MPEKIWEKYEKLKEIGNENPNIKTYLVRTEPIIKEIRPKNKEDYIIISQRIEELKQEIKIYDIIEEKEVIYIVIENNEEINEKIDKLLTSEEIDIKKEAIIEGNGSPITKNEILKLFELDKSMCKIESKTKDNQKTKGSGFFCKLDENFFPFKYALFTNNHILDESNIDIGKSIKFECLEFDIFNYEYKVIKEIKITEKRRVYTNKELDYTCIEIFESDDIENFFEIDPDIFKYNNNEILENNDIFILQFPKGNDLSFSYGTIKLIKDKIFMHNASTEEGSSGSPIIRRSDNSYVIGIHNGSKKNKKNGKYKYNVATNFVCIANDIKEQVKIEISEINCIYIADKNKHIISLFHDYNDEENIFGEDNKKLYLEAKNMNKNLFKENIEIYVNENKRNYNCKYKMDELKEIKVKFKFNHRIMKNISFIFYKCSSLKSIDLSKFNSNQVTNISWMFCGCSSLKSIDISKFNTNNVTNMTCLFRSCSSLKSIDLSSFDTNNVTDMSYMFYNCSSLNSINLSSFDINNVTNMSYMFDGCCSLNSINLSSFNTNNVTNMSYMFVGCSSLNSLDLSSFNTNNVIDISYMFYGCSSLNSLNLSKFNINNITNMRGIFCGCSSLNKNSIKAKDKNIYNLLNINLT